MSMIHNLAKYIVWNVDKLAYGNLIADISLVNTKCMDARWQSLSWCKQVCFTIIESSDEILSLELAGFILKHY